jgi:hypothetical protein
MIERCFITFNLLEVGETTIFLFSFSEKIFDLDRLRVGENLKCCVSLGNSAALMLLSAVL